MLCCFHSHVHYTSVWGAEASLICVAAAVMGRLCRGVLGSSDHLLNHNRTPNVNSLEQGCGNELYIKIYSINIFNFDYFHPLKNKFFFRPSVTLD